MEVIENGIFKLRRRRNRPMRVDGMSDLEQDLNEARGARVYLKTRETRSYLGTGYDLVYNPDKSFKDQAGKLSDNILTLQGERTRLMAADSYDGRGNDLLKLDEAINQTKKMHNVREYQDLMMGFKKNELRQAFQRLGGDDYEGLPSSSELRSRDQDKLKIVRYITEQMDKSVDDVMQVFATDRTSRSGAGPSSPRMRGVPFSPNTARPMSY